MVCMYVLYVCMLMYCMLCMYMYVCYVCMYRWTVGTVKLEESDSSSRAFATKITHCEIFSERIAMLVLELDGGSTIKLLSVYATHRSLW
uniref:Secreted protein n=1 Tax=Haemonchus contortus TaxID=6289 RepID=A0A7I5EEA1_HAECO